MRIEQKTSPARLLEMLPDRFGVFEALAYSSIKLARAAPDEERAMDVLVAEAILGSRTTCALPPGRGN